MNFISIVVTAFLSVSNLALAQSIYGLRQVDYTQDLGEPGTVVNGIPNFQKTTDSIYRGGRATLEGLQYLKKAGFKTIINLENDSKAVQNELAMAKKVGLQMYSSPLSWTTPPNDKQVDSIIASLKNSQMYPVFVHCHYGKDRTGMIIGLYRVFGQNWNPKDAYAEMIKYGYHPEYKALDNYFRAKTKMR